MAQLSKVLFSRILRGLSGFFKEMADRLDTDALRQDLLDHLSREKYGVPFSELDEKRQSILVKGLDQRS